MKEKLKTFARNHRNELVLTGVFGVTLIMVRQRFIAIDDANRAYVNETLRTYFADGTIVRSDGNKDLVLEFIKKK